MKILDGNAGTVNELIRRTTLQPLNDARGSIKFFYSRRLVTDATELERLKKFLRRIDEMEDLS